MAVLPGTPTPTAQAASTSIYWGAYIDGAPFDTTLIDHFETDAGKKESIVHWGQPWEMNGSMQAFQTPLFETVRLRGSIPMVNWNSWNLGSGITDPNYTLAKVYNGTYDAYITKWARDAKAWNHPFFIRFDHEMNGAWYSWSEQTNTNQPGDYVKAWRHVVDLFRSVGATNATWVWCPNATGLATTPLTTLYPGDAYVDWTAIDGYNNSVNTASWLPFNQIFGLNPWSLQNTYQQLVNLAPSKPIMIAETATTTSGGDAVAWINDALQTQLPQYFPRIKALVWFNWNDNDPSLPYPIESTPGQQAAFKQSIASSYYASNTFSSLPAGPIQALGATGDTTPPSVPSSVTAIGTSASQIVLSWTPSNDNVGVIGYNIYRDGALSSFNNTPITGATFSDTNLAMLATHTYIVQAQDAAGNLSAMSSTATGITLDTQPPAPPASLTATATSPTQIALSWPAATDNVGIAGYSIYRGYTLLNASLATATTFADAGLTPNTTYYYSVRAQDPAGNISSPSPMVNATTQMGPDVTPPSPPASLTATATSPTQIALSWPAATDNIGVTGYSIYRGYTLLNASLVTATTFADTGLTPNTTYYYTVHAQDLAGNISSPSPMVNATTQMGPDVTPPSPPAGFSGTATSTSQIALTWAAATDNIGVTGYNIYRGYTLLNASPVAATTFTDVGLTQNTRYYYTVRALDAAGNISSPSPMINVVTQAIDTTPPTQPTSLTATATSSTQIALSWTSSTDNVGVAGYNIFRDSASVPANTTLVTTTTFADSGLANGSVHIYTVQAVDAANNASSQSALAAATTFDTLAPSQPSGLTATGTSASQITLSWTASTDNTGVVGYNAFRDGATTPANTVPVTTTTYADAGLAPSTPHTYTVQAMDAAGNGSPLSSAASATTRDQGPVNPVVLLPTAVRLADTRTTAPVGPIAAGSSRCFTVAGQAGIPADAAGVLVNVTAVGPTGPGWVTLFPNGQSVPATSTLNFGASQFAITNGATVRVGTNGQICVNVGQSGTNIVLDAIGYIPAANATDIPLLASPARLADTRSAGGAILANTSRCFTIAGQAGIPTTATGVLLNITAVGYTGNGWLTAYPAGQSLPATSALNFDTRESAVANSTFLKIGTNGQVCISAGQSASQVIVDAVGYLTANGLVNMPLLTTPQRLVNTTSSGGPIAAGTSRCFVIAGQNGIPSTATGVLLNLTATGYSADGTLTAYANGLSPAGLPATLSFDFSSETAIPIGTFVPLGSGGQLCISAGQASTQVIIDVTGYMS